MNIQELENKYIQLYCDIENKKKELDNIKQEIRLAYNNGHVFTKIDCKKQFFYYFDIKELLSKIQPIYPELKFYDTKIDEKALRKYLVENKDKLNFLYKKNIKQYRKIREFLCASDKKILDSIVIKRENDFKINIKLHI